MKKLAKALPILTDTSIMPFGKKYKDLKMIEVPASYLIYIYSENYNIPRNLREYIVDNMQALEQEILPGPNNGRHSRRK